jgi:hypothetical protein
LEKYSAVLLVVIFFDGRAGFRGASDVACAFRVTMGAITTDRESCVKSKGCVKGWGKTGKPCGMTSIFGRILRKSLTPEVPSMIKPLISGCLPAICRAATMNGCFA